MKTRALTGYINPFSSFDADTALFQPWISGRCEIALNSDDIIGSQKEYISSIIECKNNLPIHFMIPPSQYGGLIQSVDIIDATGVLEGTLDLGSKVSITV